MPSRGESRLSCSCCSTGVRRLRQPIITGGRRCHMPPQIDLRVRLRILYSSCSTGAPRLRQPIMKGGRRYSMPSG
ncbi:hypothetical protein BKA56DRAFT_580413 [Ilyonectria sp. MPI-CAGE-AT-0026]|nr:hypothetical protein BKA56DRAFT_580413 [Ilyonectria sp. MPI-CAGE-AT-0026]